MRGGTFRDDEAAARARLDALTEELARLAAVKPPPRVQELVAKLEPLEAKIQALEERVAAAHARLLAAQAAAPRRWLRTVVVAWLIVLALGALPLWSC